MKNEPGEEGSQGRVCGLTSQTQSTNAEAMLKLEGKGEMLRVCEKPWICRGSLSQLPGCRFRSVLLCSCKNSAGEGTAENKSTADDLMGDDLKPSWRPSSSKSSRLDDDGRRLSAWISMLDLPVGMTCNDR